jgi:Ca2+-binding RTX toxin-like protein
VDVGLAANDGGGADVDPATFRFHDSVRGDVENLISGAAGGQLYGDDEANILTQGPGGGPMFGGNSNDTFKGDIGDDEIYGGPGDDKLGDPKAGADYVQGDEGIDSVSYAARAASVSLFIKTWDGQADDGAPGEDDNISADIEKITGGNGHDQIIGSHVNNSLIGRDGNDILRGRGGVDALSGGDGNDQLFSGGDNLVDSSACGAGSDSVFADPIDVNHADRELIGNA